MNTMKSLHSLLQPSSDSKRALETEIADLIGERYTLDARLQWMEARLAALREQLHAHHTTLE